MICGCYAYRDVIGIHEKRLTEMVHEQQKRKIGLKTVSPIRIARSFQKVLAQMDRLSPVDS